MEASEKRLIPEKIGWGDFEKAQKLIIDIGKGEGLGKLVSRGVRKAPRPSEKDLIGGPCMSKGWRFQPTIVMPVRDGPSLRTSPSVQPQGCWFIIWGISHDRTFYSKEN